MEEGGKHRQVPSADATGGSRTAFRFVLLIGVVSFFANLTYEGARSELGPFLAMLGASGAAVGIVSGFGELLGYGLRLVSGRTADRTGLFWPITIGGYILHMAAVPLLAFTQSWRQAAVLIILERVGKATRIRHVMPCWLMQGDKLEGMDGYSVSMKQWTSPAHSSDHC
jgi:hypothetical protein